MFARVCFTSVQGLIKNLFPKVDSSVMDTSENGWGDDDDDSFGGLERKMRGVGMSEPALRTCLKELKRQDVSWSA